MFRNCGFYAVDASDISQLWQLQMLPDIANSLHFEQVARGKGDKHSPPHCTALELRFEEGQRGLVHFPNVSEGEVWQGLRNRLQIIPLDSAIWKKNFAWSRVTKYLRDEN